MGFIDIITKLFGNKSQKDMQAVMPNNLVIMSIKPILIYNLLIYNLYLYSY